MIPPADAHSATPATHASPLLRAQLRRIKFGTLGFVALLALLFAGYGAFDYQAQIQVARNEATEIADMAMLNAQGALNLSQQVLIGMEAMLKYTPAAQQPNSALVRNTLLEWQARTPHLMDLLVVEPPGRIVHWTGQGQPPDVSDRAYVSYHLQHADSGLYVGEPQLSKVHLGAWFFGVSEAQRNAAGEVERILVAIVDLNALRAALDVSFSVPSSTLALVSRSGLVYTRSPDHEKYVGKKLERPSQAGGIARGSQAGSFTTRSPLDGKPRLVAFRKLQQQALYAVGTVNLDQVLASWRERMELLLALWLLLGASAAWFAHQLAKAAHEHEFLACTDGLTGILNRRSLLNIAEGEERRRGSENRMAVLMIDIDHFKLINDNQGHAAGDLILCRMAQILRDSCRDSDLVGRYGGEEFLAILDDTSEQGAITLAEKLRQKASGVGTPLGPLTVSIGVAITCPIGGTLDDAIRRADLAMYAAKAAGRNRVQLDLAHHAAPAVDA